MDALTTEYDRMLLNRAKCSCQNTLGSFICDCKQGYFTLEERENMLRNCSFMSYEPVPEGVALHFEKKGTGNLCIDVGALHLR
jgi:hypothetical protein